MANYNSYIIDNEIYISVTTVLGMEDKSGLIYWALKNFSGIPEYKEFMNSVSGIGTNIHGYIEQDLLGNKPDQQHYLPEAQKAISNWIQWRDDNKVEIIATELKTHSKKWRIAGTCDFLGRINGELFVGDFKTGSVQPSAFTQMSAYKSFMREMLENDPKAIQGITLEELETARLAIINIHRDGDPVKFIPLEEFQSGELTERDHLGIFHSLRYVWGKRNLKPRSKWYPVIKNIQELVDPLNEDFRKNFNV